MFKFKGIKPLFDSVVTTATTYKLDQTTSDSGLLYDVSKRKGDLNIYQRVVAVGSMVREVQVGDIVRLNYKRYAIPIHKQGALEQNIQKDNIVYTYQIPMVTIDGVDHLFVHNNDIDFVVLDPEIDEGGLLE